MWLEIQTAAPVLNTPDFSFAFGGRTGSEIPLNEQGHPYCYEFVALKGMIFKLEETLHLHSTRTYRISHQGYPSSHLFLDARFAKIVDHPPQPRDIPSPQTILQKMIQKIGTPYVWGGNWSAGIPEMLALYPPKNAISDRTARYWTLKGIDCSGLLFEASDGATPRNTSELLYFGQALPFHSRVKPLDMIIYPGHVLFILDENTTIESKFPFGVIQKNLFERCHELMQERSRVENWTSNLDPNKHFIIRRFF